MKVKIKRLLGSVVIGIFMLSLFGCNAVDENQAQTVEELLKEKYEIEFEVSSIGNRYGNGGAYILEAIANPLNDKNINFNVFLKTDRKSISDNFIARVISSKLNKVLKEELSKKGIESESYIVMQNNNIGLDITNSDIEITDYLKKANTEYLMCYAIVKETDNMDPTSFEGALKTIYEHTGNTKFNMNIIVYSEGSYEKFVDKFIGFPSFGKSYLEDFESIGEYKLTYDQEGFHNNRVENGE